MKITIWKTKKKENDCRWERRSRRHRRVLDLYKGTCNSVWCFVFFLSSSIFERVYQLHRNRIFLVQQCEKAVLQIFVTTPLNLAPSASSLSSSFLHPFFCWFTVWRGTSTIIFSFWIAVSLSLASPKWKAFLGKKSSNWHSVSSVSFLCAVCYKR